MAKYKLTRVSYYEDNEQAGDDNYNQQYVQDAADAEVVYWNRTEVELQVNDGKVYKAVADGGPTDHPERRTKWPWVLASEMLPPGDEVRDVIVCTNGKYWEKAVWRYYSKTFVVGEGEEWETEYGEKEFDHVWWRTIELPEGMQETTD